MYSDMMLTCSMLMLICMYAYTSGFTSCCGFAKTLLYMQSSSAISAVHRFVKTGNRDRDGVRRESCTCTCTSPAIACFGRTLKLKSPNQAKDYEEVGIETAEGP